MYGADVLIFEGILAFHNKELRELMDMKVLLSDTSKVVLLNRQKARMIVLLLKEIIPKF